MDQAFPLVYCKPIKNWTVGKAANEVRPSFYLKSRWKLTSPDSLQELLQGEPVFLDVGQLLELLLSEGAQLMATDSP